MSITVTSDTVEITKLVTSAVTSLVWPGVILAIAFMFRPYIAEVINRATVVEWGALKVSFETKLETAEQRAGQLQIEDAALDEPPPPAQAQDLPPDYMVLEAWRRVEAELIAVAERSGMSLRRGRSPLFLIKSMRSTGMLDPETLALLDDLRALRNVAVHQEGSNPVHYDQAVRYRDLADLVITRLKQAGQ